MRPCGATRAGTQAPPLPISIIFFHTILHKQKNHLHAIHPNDTNHPHAIRPNETVGAVPMCPPECPHSGVSIPRIHALYAGNERWMRPCGATRAGSGVSIPKIHALCAGDERRIRPYRATRAGTQAPPLPNSVTHNTSGAEMHRALPPPFLK